VLADRTTRGETYEIGGPDNLTMTRLAELVQQADGRPGTPRHVPPAMLRLAAMTVGLAVPQLRRQALTSLWTDADDHALTIPGARARFPGLPSTHVAALLR
jgi:NADH dehydrogenase